MKVLQLGKFYPIRGGVEKVMWDLTQGLGNKGYKCDMLCACLPEDTVDYKDRSLVVTDRGVDIPQEAKYVLQLSEGGRLICVPAVNKVAATMISPAMIKALKFMLRQAAKMGEPYDVVHVHHPDPMATLALMLSGYKGRVVLHWHSDIVKQKGLLKFYLPLQKWIVGRACRIVGTTPVYVKESPYLAKAQDKVTYLPIGVEGFTPTVKGIEQIRNRFPGKKLIFSLGRLVPYKGFSYLVEAARFLPDDYQVVIGGQGPLRGSLEQQATELGVLGKVEFLGWIDDADTADWFGASDVFVLSSVMKTEAFAIVQIEAMSCGTPVVATRIPGSGVSWVNEHGTSGLNVPICDAKALADAIVAVCNEREKYGAAARNRFENNFTLDRMIDRCKGIYENL